jgi:hypothetical protein
MSLHQRPKLHISNHPQTPQLPLLKNICVQQLHTHFVLKLFSYVKISQTQLPLLKVYVCNIYIHILFSSSFLMLRFHKHNSLY